MRRTLTLLLKSTFVLYCVDLFVVLFCAAACDLVCLALPGCALNYPATCTSFSRLFLLFSLAYLFFALSFVFLTRAVYVSLSLSLSLSLFHCNLMITIRYYHTIPYHTIYVRRIMRLHIIMVEVGCYIILEITCYLILTCQCIIHINHHSVLYFQKCHQVYQHE